MGGDEEDTRFDQAGSTTFHNPALSTTEDLIPAALSAYNSRPFTRDRYLFSTGTRLHGFGQFELKSENKDAGVVMRWSTFLRRVQFEVKAERSPGAPEGTTRTLTALFYEDGSLPAKLKEMGTITLSENNVEPSSNMARHCTISGNTVIIEPELKKAEALTDSHPHNDVTVTQQEYYLRLMDVSIEPTDGMVGVLGDVIKSAKKNSRVRHFVTPKAQTDYLPQEYVEFEAKGAPDDNPNITVFADLFEWEGGEPGSDARKRKVSRTSSGNGPTILKLKTKKDHVVVDEMHVWVVWCDAPTVIEGTGIFEPKNDFEIVAGVPVDVYKGAMYRTSSPWWFTFAIKPSAICTEAERPDLSGPNTNDPPGADKVYSFNPAKFADTATSKWDVSRQIKVSVRNPNSISKALLESSFPAAFCINQPTPDDSPVVFPSVAAEGNDDPEMDLGVDEDNDPYNATASGLLQHGTSQLTSIDYPRFYADKSWGGTANHFGAEDNFREFCRLEITDGHREDGTVWFRISDYYKWHFYLSTDFDGAQQKWIPPSSSRTGPDHPIP